MINQIDHVAIGCDSLEQGVAAMAETLGVTVPQGSKHAAMSTHNCVGRVGDGCFLELISIDPDAPDPGRKRWFSLDDPYTRSRLAARPRALCWVVNTTNLDAMMASSPLDLGEVVGFSRGDRTWRLTVPVDGGLPGAGLLPALIEWSPGPHPSEAQQDLGVRLVSVALSHPQPEILRAALLALQIDHLATLTEGPVGLQFQFDTPQGRVIVD